jgi:hypothetical protein
VDTEETDGKRRSGLLVETGSLAMPSPRPSGVNVTAELDRYVLLNGTDGSACPFGDRFLLRLDQSSSGSFDSNAAAR